MEQPHSLNTMSSFPEDVVMMNGAGGLTQSEESAVRLALNSNEAVGIVAGSYDEALTVTFASGFFFDFVGYAPEESMALINCSLLSFIHDGDKHLFALGNFQSFSGDFAFRLIDRAGQEHPTRAFKTESTDAQGRPQWVLSVRLSHDNSAMAQLFSGMTKLVARFAICDLANNRYDYYGINDHKYRESGTYDEFLQSLDSMLKLTANSEPLSTVMSVDYLRQKITGPDDIFKYEYMSLDEQTYYNMAIIPLVWESGVLAKMMMIGQDVTEAKLEQMRGQLALREAYHAANRANSAKTQFLSNMSHDIRTPMNAIIGMTAIASAHADQPERVMDCLGKITTASRHLLGLINEVLDMSRIENGKMSLAEEEFNISELVDNMVQLVKPGLTKHHHDFEVQVLNLQHERVYSDTLRLQQVFTNVMGNAIKYTPDGGKITLSINEKEARSAGMAGYEFAIEDTGIGMSKDFQKILFEPFAREDTGRITEVQGTGLGMTITKSIVNMMGGNIAVDSEQGKGTKVTFTVFLKLANQTEEYEVHFDELPVLVVDDDIVSCESTVATLDSIGMRGEYTQSGLEAVNLVSERIGGNDAFYAVILDWKMPEIDGIETARRIRKVVGPQVPIIMLTAYDFDDVMEEARLAGVDFFIEKPLFKSRLIAAFRQLGQKSGQATAQPAQEDSNIWKQDYSGKRVLVVEDNVLNQEILVEIVGATGAAVEVANNGKEAVDMVYQNPAGYYDLIFMDIQMPIMNGYEATMAIRALDDQKGKTVPIVALTANAFAEDAVLSKNAGVNEHVAKPIGLDKLDEVMQRWIGAPVAKALA